MQSQKEQNIEREPIMYKIGKGIGYVINNPRSLTFPVLGNLSQKVQKRIEENAEYGADLATNVSYVTNGLLYTGAAGFLANSYFSGANDLRTYLTGVVASSLAGAVIGVGEAFVRSYNLEDHEFQDSGRASLLGKIVSLPIEAGMGAYDAIKQGAPARNIRKAERKKERNYREEMRKMNAQWEFENRHYTNKNNK